MGIKTRIYLQLSYQIDVGSIVVLRENSLICVKAILSFVMWIAFVCREAKKRKMKPKVFCVCNTSATASAKMSS